MADSPIYRSYFDAHVASKSSPAPKDTARTPDVTSKASTHNYRPASPGPMARPASPSMGDGSFIHTMPRQRVSVLHRPVKPCTMKNAENLDVQFEKDKQAFERHANTYRRLAQEKYHHNRSPGSIITLWEEGHIVDRGRGKSDVEVSRGLFDPILSEFKIPPSTPSPQKQKQQRPMSAPHTRPDKVMQDTMGRYNPITHTYDKTGDDQYTARKQKEFERAHGGLGIASRADQNRTFNPITGDFKTLPARPSSAPRAQRASASGAGAAGVAPASPAPAGSGPRASIVSHDRPATPSKAMQGESWGTYDPICHRWQVPPKDRKYEAQNDVLDRQAGISGTHVRKVATPPRQGVYNPITNTWTVPPADSRVMAGLSFQPATLFSRPTPATCRA